MGSNNITTSGTITAATNSKLGDITIANGSITSDTATIDKGVNNVQTTGSINADSALKIMKIIYNLHALDVTLSYFFPD